MAVSLVMSKVTGCSSWTFGYEASMEAEYESWRDALCGIEVEGYARRDRASGRCFLVVGKANRNTIFPIAAPRKESDELIKFTHALLPLKTPKSNHEIKRMTCLLHRLALSPVRMLACTFEPNIMKELSEHFRCIGNFETADVRRLIPNKFVYLYINTGVN
jgi:hypothetical protein